MKIPLLTTLSALSSFFVMAQSPTFQWAKMSPYPVKESTSDANGNYYTTGYFSNTIDCDPGPGTTYLTSHSGSNDICISKFDGSGSFIWAKNMGGSKDDYGLSSVVDANGNVFTVGYFIGSADFDPNAGTFILNSSSSTDTTIFISKLNATGNLVWAKEMGGIGKDVGYSIALDGSGNVFTAGYFSQTADFDPSAGVFNLTAAGSTDIFVAKLDASGNFLWAKKVGSIGDDVATNISTDGSGNVYAFGTFQDTTDFNPGAGINNLNACSYCYNTFILKLDATGNFLWAKQVDFIMNSQNFDGGNPFTVDATGNVFITGIFAYLQDFDLGAGTYNMHDNNGSVFITKLDAFGNFSWAEQFGCSSTYTFTGGSGYQENMAAHSIALDATGNIYTTGYFLVTSDFDPGTGTYMLSPLPGADTNFDSRVFISKLDASGNFKWAKAFGGTGFEDGHFITIDVYNNVFTSGVFCSGADFDPGPGIYHVSSPSGCGFSFIHKMSQITSGIEEIDVANFITIYPNPSQNNITIKMENNTLCTISIIDVLGKEIKHLQTTEILSEINVSELTDGVYFVIMNQNGHSFVQKIIISK